MNLLLNTTQALDDQGEITASTDFTDDAAWVEISDNGKGIPAEIQQQIIEPFFATKPAGKGTGLGLSIAFDNVQKKHGGRIEVDSTVGRGDTYRITPPTSHCCAHH